MAVFARVAIAALAAYVLIGLVYATWETIYFELIWQNPRALPPPWTGSMAFPVWFLLPAAFWLWNLVGFHHVPEILVACVYLATVGLFYLAASRRSAPRRLKSSYPNNR